MLSPDSLLKAYITEYNILTFIFVMHITYNIYVYMKLRSVASHNISGLFD